MQLLDEAEQRYYCFKDDQLWLGKEQKLKGRTASEASGSQGEQSVLAKGTASYWGGHFLRPAGKVGDIGTFAITSGKFVFAKGSLWKIEMPFDRIVWKSISQATGEDIGFKNKMVFLSLLGTGLPVASGSVNVTYITIPFKDEKGIDESPRFTFPDSKFLDQISKFIYERMTT
jgi:hypothetical protein